MLPDDRAPLAEAPENDAVIMRADTAIAEASRLREVHRQLRAQVDQQVERMRQIEEVLDTLFPHPPDELRRLRAATGLRSVAVPF